MKFKVIYLITIMVCFQFCNSKHQSSSDELWKEEQDLSFERNKEAREDSIKLREAYLLMNNADHTVYPKYQTDPVDEDSMEDAADDPAFWYNPDDPGSSIIYGSNKKGGIYSYNLSGEKIEYYPVGDINNIDTRSQVSVGGKTMDMLGGSNRTDNSITLMKIDASGKLNNLLDQSFTIDTTYVNEVYGFCLYKDSENTGYAIVNGKNGQIVVYEIIQNPGNPEKVLLAKKYNWKLKTQPEGMVADDVNGILYVGEEQYGIWKMKIEENSTPEVIRGSRPEYNPAISYDIEGLALYIPDPENDESGFILASIQGSFTYAIFERSSENKYITNFSIGSKDGIDGVEETDGLEIVSESVGDEFPNGLLIVQDGFNYNVEVLDSQNFKVIDLKQVIDLIETEKLAAGTLDD